MSSNQTAKKTGRTIPAGKTYERNFLTETHKPVRERKRLRRIHDEFARAVGAELAKAGLAALTGGGRGILMGAKFWEGMKKWGQFMMEQGVFTKDEITFGHVTESPAVRQRLKLV